MATEARIYYNKVMRRVVKRPTKILQHQLYPSLGMCYLCFWPDVGYANQDEEGRKPAEYAMQFPGPVEDYRPHQLVSLGFPKHAHMVIWETMTLCVYEISNCLLKRVLFSRRKP